MNFQYFQLVNWLTAVSLYQAGLSVCYMLQRVLFIYQIIASCGGHRCA